MDQEETSDETVQPPDSTASGLKGVCCRARCTLSMLAWSGPGSDRPDPAICESVWNRKGLLVDVLGGGAGQDERLPSSRRGVLIQICRLEAAGFKEQVPP